MKIYTYKTIGGLMRGAGDKWFTLNEFLKGRFEKSGKRFYVSDQLKKELVTLFAKGIWERCPERNAHKITKMKPCGILSRVYITKNSFNRYCGRYCAGQDYPSEIRLIQRIAHNS